MATVNIGNLTFTHRGDYASGTAYVKNDVVYYSTNGNAYIAKQATTGNAPTNGTYWSQFAAGSGGIWNAGLSLGSAGQQLQVNSGGTALEFATISSGVIKQKKYYYFTDSFNKGAASWEDLAHPIGDGTITMTPTASGNILTVVWDFAIMGGATWFYSSNRMLVSTDGGSSYGYITGTDGGSTHGQGIYLESSTALRSEHQEYWHVAANTNAHKFKIQNYGRSGGGGINVNQDDHPGGTEVSRVILTEYDISNSGVTQGAL